MMKIRVLTTIEEYRELYEAHLLLLKESQTSPIFMLPAYQYAWWECLGEGQLRILVIEDANELVGLAPLFITTENNQQIVKLIGAYEVSDYLDILARPQHASEVYELIVQYWRDQVATWNEIKLQSLPAASAALTLLPPLVAKLNCPIHTVVQDVCPVVILPKTWSEYMDGLEPAAAKNFKRLQKSIGADDEISYSLSTAETMSADMKTFIELHRQSGQEKAAFWTPGREEFFIKLGQELIKTPYLKLYFLEVNGEKAASLLIFDFNNEFLIYNSGFNAYRYGHLGVGNALILYTIQEAIKLGRSRYDFMRGNEKYKYLFGSSDEQVFDLSITRPGG